MICPLFMQDLFFYTVYKKLLKKINTPYNVSVTKQEFLLSICNMGYLKYGIKFRT